MINVDGLIFLTQAGLLALLLFLAFRVHTLVRSEPQTAGPMTASSAPARHSQSETLPLSVTAATFQNRTDLITQLHILAGLQERDCRVRGLALSSAPGAVRTYAAAWLYGAGCALCDRPSRHSDRLIVTVAQIASRKTGIRQPEAVQAIATLTSSAVLLACFRAGLEGAEFWRHNHFVPPTSSLYEAITANAFI